MKRYFPQSRVWRELMGVPVLAPIIFVVYSWIADRWPYRPYGHWLVRTYSNYNGSEIIGGFFLITAATLVGIGTLCLILVVRRFFYR